MPDSIDVLQTSKLKNWLVAQQRSQEQQRQGQPFQADQPPVITISRQTGCGGVEIARQLGQELGWEVWEREIVDKIARDANVHRQMVELLDERASWALGELSRALFRSTQALSSQTYLKHLFGTIISIAQQGRAIIVGRGAYLILPAALNVRLVASFDYRLQHLMEQFEISEREAEQRMVRSDQERADFVRGTFGADIDDVALYDLTIRVNAYPLEDVFHIIKASLKAKFPALKVAVP